MSPCPGSADTVDQPLPPFRTSVLYGQKFGDDRLEAFFALETHVRRRISLPKVNSPGSH